METLWLCPFRTAAEGLLASMVRQILFPSSMLGVEYMSNSVRMFCRWVLLVVVMFDCTSSKPDIVCTTGADCMPDVPYCDVSGTQCTQSTYSISEGICRQDQLSNMLHKSCESIFDCKSNSLDCFPCNPELNCPTCAQPVPGCVSGFGYCDTVGCQFGPEMAAPPPTCSAAGPCRTLIFCRDQCPVTMDGGLDESDAGSG
jgi:hypothetical protein